MKPIKLEIEGLHSFESAQTIDFTQLGMRGIFGIFGATGSGKSTILDAVILALYGKVQRSKTNSDFINLKSKKAVVSFEFSFVDDGKEKVFLIKRSFKRKNKNQQEVDQVAEIFEVGVMGMRQILEGVNKVDNFIIDLLGMSDSEFLKCIALPQGEFASFLKAKPNERVSIIGNIFDLNKYGQELWEKIKNKTDQLDQNMAIIDGKLAVIGEVDEKQLQTDKEQIKKYKKEKQDKSSKLEVLIKTEKDERLVAELGVELETVEKNLKSLEVNNETILLRKDTLKKAKKIYENQFVLNRTEELSALLLKEEEDIYKKEEILNSQKLRGDELYIESVQELEDLKSKAEISVAKIERLKTLKELETKNIEISKNINTITQDLKIAENKVEGIEKKIKTTTVDRNLVINEIKLVDNKLADIKEKLSGYDVIISYRSLLEHLNELKSYRAYVEQKHLEAIQVMSLSIEKLDKLMSDKKTTLADIKSLYKEAGVKGGIKEGKLVDVLISAHNENAKFIRLKSLVESILKNRMDIEIEIKAEENKKLRIEKEKLRLDIKISEVSDEIIEIEDQIKKYRASKDEILAHNGLFDVIDNLKIGDQCPVCNSEVLEKAYPNHIDIVVVENEIIELEQVLARKAEAKENLIYAVAKNLSVQESINLKILELEEKQSKLREELRILIEGTSNETIINESEILKEMEDSICAKIKKAEKLVDKENQLYQLLKETELELSKNNCISATARMEVEAFGELLERISADIKIKDTSLLALVSGNEDIANKVQQMRELNDLMDKTVKEKEDLLTKQSDLDSQISKLESELAILNKEINDFIYNRSALEYELRANVIQIEADVVGGGVEGAIACEQQHLEGLKHRQAELDRLQEERTRDIHAIENEVAMLKSLNKAHIEEHKKLTSLVKELLLDLKLNSIQDARLYMMDEEEIKSLNSSIENHQNNVLVAQNRKKELETFLNGRVSSPVILSQIISQVESLRNELSSLDESIIKLDMDLKIREEKLISIKGLKSEYSKLEKEFTTAKELYEILRGKALLEFIAEEFINDISFMASSKLQVLMDGRYVLKYQDREFFVVDNFNDASIRPVSTLSGGEIFVVSLALALSISDAIASKSNKNIDFFFLDEGFGTLDKEYCEYIVDSLIKLESQNLTIGLISHIPELQEKITHKLEVVKTPNGSIVRNQFDI